MRTGLLLLVQVLLLSHVVHAVSRQRFRAAKVLQQVGRNECSKLPTPPFPGFTRKQLARHCTDKGSKCNLCDDGLIDGRSINKEKVNLCVMHKSHCVPPRISFTMPNPWSDKTRKRMEAMETANKKWFFLYPYVDLSGWTITKKLGDQGDVGDVYLATDSRGKVCIAKLLPTVKRDPGYPDEPWSERRFKGAIHEALAQLAGHKAFPKMVPDVFAIGMPNQQSHIPRVDSSLTVQHLDERFFIFMGRAKGSSMASLLEKGELNDAKRDLAFAAIDKAFDKLYSKTELIQWDPNPGNQLITFTGSGTSLKATVELVDFDQVRVTDGTKKKKKNI